jgi:quinol monooxygenase YgiN
MTETDPVAIVISIRTVSGKRAELRALWEEHLAPRVTASSVQQVYVVAEDAADADVLHLLEVYSDAQEMARNASQPWFAEYMKAAAPLLAGPPAMVSGAPVWVKPPLA